MCGEGKGGASSRPRPPEAGRPGQAHLAGRGGQSAWENLEIVDGHDTRCARRPQGRAGTPGVVAIHDDSTIPAVTNREGEVKVHGNAGNRALPPTILDVMAGR